MPTTPATTATTAEEKVRTPRTYSMSKVQVHSDLKDTGDCFMEVEEALERVMKSRPELRATLAEIRDKSQALRSELIAIGARYHAEAYRVTDGLNGFSFVPHADEDH